jgi:hypothetical protein
MHNLGSFFGANLPQLGQLGQIALQAGQLGIHVSPQAQGIAALLVLLSQLHAAPANAAPEQIPTTVVTPQLLLVPPPGSPQVSAIGSQQTSQQPSGEVKP